MYFIKNANEGVVCFFYFIFMVNENKYRVGIICNICFKRSCHRCNAKPRYENGC